jgi:hypothetical protein
MANSKEILQNLTCNRYCDEATFIKVVCWKEMCSTLHPPSRTRFIRYRRGSKAVRSYGNFDCITRCFILFRFCVKANRPVNSFYVNILSVKSCCLVVLSQNSVFGVQNHMTCIAATSSSASDMDLESQIIRYLSKCNIVIFILHR